MKKNEFKGIWEFDIDISNLEISCDNLVLLDSLKIKFEDDLSDIEEPLNCQFKTYDYITQEIVDIIEVIQERAKRHKKIISPSTNIDEILILMSSKNEFSYYLVGNNERTQFLLYKNEIIYIGWIGNKYGGVQRALKKDGSVIRGSHKFIPKKFRPSSKYNTLKPSHKKANENFEVNLIRYKYNELFMELVIQKEINVNGSNKNLSFLSTACFSNNNQIVSFLLEQGAETNGALHWCSYWNNNKEAISLLIKNDANINFQDDFGWTVLHRQASELGNLYQQKNRELESEWETEKTDKKINDRKNTIKFLINSGADPYIKNSIGSNAIQVAVHLTDKFKDEIEVFFKENKKADNKI